MARVFGIKFYSVLDRGSQFRVESMLLRLSKAQNYLLLSISPQQRAKQAAMECLPLILEPISNFYTEPVVVLDFQSLYPSMMIAYNICYSTCLGRVPMQSKKTNAAGETKATTSTSAPTSATTTPQRQHPNQQPHQVRHLPSSQTSETSQQSQQSIIDSPIPVRLPAPTLNQPLPTRVDEMNSSPSPSDFFPPPMTSPVHKLGGTVLPRSSSLLGELNAADSLWVASNGCMFTKPAVRQGVLPRMLKEILATRVMVKASMKREEVGRHRGLHRLLNARQHGLKLISNVTYGYTAAGFSGRMPCAEIADSIVQTARDTLERAIQLVENHPRWKARVVYGDTDSLFVLLQGRSKEEAFQIGREIAHEVTQANPKPVKLQLEKVYLPCMLLSKKRYVGYKYESPDQTKPSLDAKGIEMVRRDGCPAVVKTMESVIRILFETRDLSLIRTYLDRQWSKVWSGRVSLQDFIFAKEVRLGNYTHPPLGAVLSHRLMACDLRATPLHGERVPYVIVDGEPHSRLVDRVQHPLAVILRPDMFRLGAVYYIEVVINRPLQRLLELVGVDLTQWYTQWSKPRRQPLAAPLEGPIVRKQIGPIVAGKLNHSHKNASSTSSSSSSRPPLPPSRTRLGLPAPTGDARIDRDGTTTLYTIRRTIDQYYRSQHCASKGCQEMTVNQPFCARCQEATLFSLGKSVGGSELGDLTRLARGSRLRHECLERLYQAERVYHSSLATCRACVGDGRMMGSCGGGPSLIVGPIQVGLTSSITLQQSGPHQTVPCTSLDCPNQFTRQKRWQALKQAQEWLEFSAEREKMQH